jgi:hypothetical protein
MGRSFGLLILGLFVLGLPSGATAGAEPDAVQSPIPALAYYYIWYDADSWDRAKSDYPLLGRYSSDDANVMRQHVRWAKQAGLRGFIVSWKGTEKLSRRLEQLIEIAHAEDFKLAIIYQGLDFERRPIPIEQVAADLQLFADRYAPDPVFDLFDRPLVIWSGTWQFSAAGIASVTATLRDRLLILASERNVKGYLRLADAVEGDAYYWSSVDPQTYPNYQGKLDELAAAVHDDHGLWIAPAAVGFDARLVGGARVVERADGKNLRAQLAAALRSGPDAVGVISWNEFSENSQLEPSKRYGDSALKVLADALGAAGPELPAFDSSTDSSTTTAAGNGSLERMAAGVLLAIGTLGALAFTYRRARRTQQMR